MEIKTFETEIAGKKITVEHGRMAHQAGAAVTVRMGDTIVMGTATMAVSRRDINFFPLMVDYEERYSAAGAIKGPRFMKREGRPSFQAILNGRKIDRGLRPLFPDGMRNEVQIILLPLSLDHENRPDIVAMMAASIALHISNIPFDGPIGGLRIGRVNGDLMVNPTASEMEFSDLTLEVMGDGERIIMVDCSADDIPEGDIQKAFALALEHLGPLAKFIDDIRKEIGVEKATHDELKWRGSPEEEDLAVIEQLKTAAIPQLEKYLFNKPVGSKRDRKKIWHELEEKLAEEFSKKLATEERDEEATKAYLEKLMGIFFYEFIEEQVTLAILDRDQRVDGRKLDEIRTLDADVGFLPRVHGSGLFARGETQVMSTVTLGAPGDDMLIETMELEGKKKYFHHYNFLPYSVGEVKPIRGAGRREIGHGMLAEKALVPVIPSTEDFPYTVRVVSEIMGSNGSSSMGSTVGSTLALMDAGVPIKKPVAGMAMGLASDGKRWKVLTDLQDLEDGAGGMDFKFTGTRDGITAIQMDTKTRGLDMAIIEKTLTQTRKALNEVIDVIEAAIPTPKTELSEYAPRIISFKIDPEKIGEVIGPGGKVIRKITEEYGVDIDIVDDGTVMITSTDAKKGETVAQIVKDIVKVVEVGEVYEDAEVVKIMSFGAFVKLTPGTDAMVHVSEIEWGHVDQVTDRLKEGDKVTVKVIKIERGKVDASIRALTPKPEGYVEKPRRPRPSGGRDRRGGGRDRRGGDRDRRGGGRDRRGGDRDRRGGDRDRRPPPAESSGDKRRAEAAEKESAPARQSTGKKRVAKKEETSE